MKSLYKFLWVPVVIILLQSCLVAKDYQEPDIEQQNYYRTDNIPQDSINNIAEVSWEEMFTDQYLHQYIDKALTNNIDIRIALEQIKAAEAYVKQGKADYLPTISAGADYTRSYYSKNSQQGLSVPPGSKDHFDNYNLSANLSWEADIWGKIRSQKRAFVASYLQTVAAHKAVKTRLVANIASSYYQLLAIDEQMKVTQKTIESRKDGYETTKAIKEAGLGTVTSADVQQAEAQYLNSKSLMLDLQAQSRFLESTICILMGESPHSIERSSLEDQDISTELKIGVPSQLLTNRPDVVMAENNYRQAFEMTNVARANFYPSLTIGASGGFQAMELSKWFDIKSLFGNFIGGLTAPLLNGRMIRTQFEVAKIQQEQAKLNLQGVLLQASKDVSDALYDYQNSSKKYELKNDERKLLDQALEDSQEIFKSGYANASYLEVLIAQEKALGANIEMINTRLAQLNSIVDLYQALGGGWQ